MLITLVLGWQPAQRTLCEKRASTPKQLLGHHKSLGKPIKITQYRREIELAIAQAFREKSRRVRRNTDIN
jgi:hypothetical protein